MHTIYHTEAFVLRQVESGEANARVWLFTRELGLIVATVQGIRKSGAKLRSQLINYSTVSVDLVRGRDVWRLTSATLIENPLSGRTRSLHARAYVRILGAVYRFLAEEGEPHEQIFTHLLECRDMLLREDIDTQGYDTLGIWRVLVHLGYIAVPLDMPWLQNAPFREVTAKLTPPILKTLRADAERAITHAHL